MTHPQGEGSAPSPSIERMCALAGVSRASFYRRWGESELLREETALRDALH
jgi:putative transposase